MLGGFSVWRDVEKRYVPAILGLPISRKGYVFGKFAGVALAFLGCSFVLGLAGICVISLAGAFYPSEIPVSWSAIIVSIFAYCLKYVLLAAFGLLFSSLSTSFFLPVFGTLAIYLAGSASQQVMEYLTGNYSQDFAPLFQKSIQVLYYILPNFSAFDLEVYAVYSLPLDGRSLILIGFYFVVYTTLVLSAAGWAFGRRELN